jgi:hypothetical protein
MADTTILIAVTWGYKPFKFENTYIGDITAICKDATNKEDCMFKCNTAEFENCLRAVIDGDPYVEYHDRWHGFFVIATENLDIICPFGNSGSDENTVKNYIYAKYSGS